MMLSVMSCFAACSSERKDSADVKPEIARFEPLTAITEGGRNIYLIVKLVDSSYWQVIINGARDAGDLSALKKCADTALYKAKEKGRNRYIWFTA